MIPSTSRGQRAMLGLDFAQTASARDGVEHRYRATVRIPAKGRLRLMKGLFYEERNEFVSSGFA